VPPTGWTPKPGLKPAPKNWQFWLPNDQWKASSVALYRSIQHWLHAAGGTALVAIIAAAVAAAFGFPPYLLLLAALCLFATVVLLGIHRVRRQRLTRNAFEALGSKAERARNERLVSEYKSYLLAIS